MEWIELRVHTLNEAIDPVTNILNNEGANGVVIENQLDLEKEHRHQFGELYELDPAYYPLSGVYIKAYFINNASFQEKLNHIKNKISELVKYDIRIGEVQYRLQTVAEEDWENEWKKYFKRKKVTNRFTIVPMWEKRLEDTADDFTIFIDPGMAFGTGTHPTTVLSLQGLEDVVHTNDMVLDVGSGSGILSIASILLGASNVYAYDLDEVAVSSTKMNALLNEMNDQIFVQQNDLLQGVNKQVDVIVSNTLAEIIIHLIDDAWNNLVDDGIFITSGIIHSKRDIVKNALIKKGFNIIKENKLENWVSFIAQK